MAEKPPFDPSKPFQAAAQQKPAFDPSKPFSPAESSPAPESSFLESAGKNILGFAHGVGESVNPGTWPHALEVLGRAATYGQARGEGAPKSFGEAFKIAEEKSVTPKGDLADVGAGIRTLARIPLNPNKPIADLFNEEKKSQTQYQNMLPEGAKKLGEYTGSAIQIGQAAKDLISAIPGVTGKVGSLANEAAVSSLKPAGKQGKALLANEDRVAKLGQTLRDEGIVTSGASYKDIMNRTENALDKYGKEIGHFSKSADTAIARDSSIRSISIDNISNKVSNSLIPDLIETGNADIAKQVSDFVNGNLKAAAGSTGEIGFQQMQKIKTSLAKTKAKFDAVRDTNSSEAFQQLWNVLNDAHESGIENALSKAGSADEMKSFLKAKDRYRDLKDAEKYITDTVGRLGANRWPSLTDYMAGGSAMVAGGAAAGLPGLGVAVPAVLANRILRTRGNQMATGLYGAIEKQLLKSPSKYAPVGATKNILEENGGQ